jgi:UrcA family protein
MKSMRRAFFAACTTGLLIAAPAMAASSPDEFEVRVRYGDLDIEQAAGVRVLYDRLQHASARACETGSYRELGSLQRVRDAQACYVTVLDSLVAGIDSKALKALHDS